MTDRRGEISTAAFYSLSTTTTTSSSPSSSPSVSYARDADCTWVVEARPGRTISFRFVSMEVRSADAQCQQDYITVKKT